MDYKMRKEILLLGLLLLLVTTVSAKDESSLHMDSKKWVTERWSMPTEELITYKENIMDEIEKTQLVEPNNGLNKKVSKLFDQCEDIDNFLKYARRHQISSFTRGITNIEGTEHMTIHGNFEGTLTEYLIKVSKHSYIKYSSDGGKTFSREKRCVYRSVSIGNGLSISCDVSRSEIFLNVGDTLTFTAFPYNGCGTEQRGILIR